MTRPKLTIDECMSPHPYSIQHDASLSAAVSMMNEHGIRHLPVMKDEVLVGIVSMRDILMLRAVNGSDAIDMTVGRAAHDEVYTVEVGTPLREVAANMGGRKYGSALVLDKGKLVGVFTTIDAMRVLINLLD